MPIRRSQTGERERGNVYACRFEQAHLQKERARSALLRAAVRTVVGACYSSLFLKAVVVVTVCNF
jgi:hypothetical protein